MPTAHNLTLPCDPQGTLLPCHSSQRTYKPAQKGEGRSTAPSPAQAHCMPVLPYLFTFSACPARPRSSAPCAHLTSPTQSIQPGVYSNTPTCVPQLTCSLNAALSAQLRPSACASPGPKVPPPRAPRQPERVALLHRSQRVKVVLHEQLARRGCVHPQSTAHLGLCRLQDTAGRGTVPRGRMLATCKGHPRHLGEAPGSPARDTPGT